MIDMTSDTSFTKWLDSTFKRVDRRERDEPEDPFEQYHVDYGMKVLAHSTRLFRNPTMLQERYSPEQIEAGLWVLSLEELSRWIWEKEIDWPIRRDCIWAMTQLFEQLFAKHVCGDACYMWWDHLRSVGDDFDPNVNQALLEALSRILELDCHDCQKSALHGLGHLEHPDKRKVIEKFLGSHVELNQQTKQYAEAAMESRVL